MPVAEKTVEVFFCTMGQSNRSTMAEDCYAAWRAVGIVPHWITPANIGVEPQEFQKDRRVYAETHAVGPYYIVVDDDCLPPEGDWIPEAIRVMDSHPEFMILSLLPSNAPIYPWTPEDYAAFGDADVMEHISVGNVRFCRKGMLKDWPLLEGKYYDMPQCEAIRKAGYRVGYFKNIHGMIHLGEGHTTLR